MEEGGSEGRKVPQGLDDDVEEAVVLALHVAEAPHQLEESRTVGSVLIHQAMPLDNSRFST